MSLVKQIIAKHALLETVEVGDIVSANIDRIYIQDGNAPTIKRLFEKHNFKTVFDAKRIAVFFDHSVLSPNIDISNRLKEALAFCYQHQLQIYNQGDGISHVVAVENGWFEPGNLVVATDSHTCTGGVVQSLALGMGATDVCYAMITGKTWLRVPETSWIKTIGKPSQQASAKDVMLYALSVYKDQRFLYHAIEWSGDWFQQLSFDQAATVANMGVEMGAKCVFLPPWRDCNINMQAIEADPHHQVVLDISDLPPYVAKPHSPYDSVQLDEVAGKKIDYVFVGSCTNSRLEDIAAVASILKSNKIKGTTRFIMTPGSKSIYLSALKLGYIETILESGGIVTPPGCGSCVGTQGHIPASGDHILSTMNRNFLGRMGNKDANIWLASPIVAAFTALKGEIPSIRDIANAV